VKPSVQGLLKPLKPQELGEEKKEMKDSVVPSSKEKMAHGHRVSSQKTTVGSSRAPDRNGIIEAMRRRIPEEETDAAESSKRDDCQTMRGRISSLRMGGRNAWSRVKPSVQGLLKPRIPKELGDAVVVAEEEKQEMQDSNVADARPVASTSAVNGNSRIGDQEPWAMVRTSVDGVRTSVQDFLKQIHCSSPISEENYFVSKESVPVTTTDGSRAAKVVAEEKKEMEEFKSDSSIYSQDMMAKVNKSSSVTKKISSTTRSVSDDTNNIIKAMRKRVSSNIENMEGKEPWLKVNPILQDLVKHFNCTTVSEENFQCSGDSVVTSDFFDGPCRPDSFESGETTYFEDGSFAKDDSIYRRNDSFSTLTY
jgi:hypothetical protein